MKKRMLAILMGIVMLMSLSLTVGAAGINNSPRDIVFEEEPCQSAEEFFNNYDLHTVFNNQKKFYKDTMREICSTDEAAFERLKAFLADYFEIHVETVDEAVDAGWECEGTEFFYAHVEDCIYYIQPDNYISINSDNCFDEEVQRLYYIYGIYSQYDLRGDYDSCEADVNWTMEEIKDYVYNEMFQTETTTSVEETTASTEETTEPATDEETTEPASTEETTAGEETEETTAETTTAAETTAASHENETDNPNTGDVSMLMYGVTAIVSGLGAVATRKRK